MGATWLAPEQETLSANVASETPAKANFPKGDFDMKMATAIVLLAGLKLEPAHASLGKQSFSFAVAFPAHKRQILRAFRGSGIGRVGIPSVGGQPLSLRSRRCRLSEVVLVQSLTQKRLDDRLAANIQGFRRRSSSSNIGEVKSTFTRWIGPIMRPLLVKKRDTSSPRSARRAIASAEGAAFVLRVLFIDSVRSESGDAWNFGASICQQDARNQSEADEWELQREKHRRGKQHKGQGRPG